MNTSGMVVNAVEVERAGFRAGPISLEVGRGEELWLVGPNGSGKSTLLAVFAGLLPALRGTVELCGRTIVGPGTGVPAWQRDVTILLQDLGLWPHLSVGRQAHLVATDVAKRSTTPDAESPTVRIARIADVLGVTELLDRKPRALSGGEAQRCALLRTLAPERSLILLDEPLGAQHSEGRERIERVLASERARGAMVLIAGHQPPPAARTVQLGGGRPNPR